MPTKNLPFRIEKSSFEGTHYNRLIAACDNIDTARAAFKWAQQQYPSAHLVLMNGDRVMAEAGVRAVILDANAMTTI